MAENTVAANSATTPAHDPAHDTLTSLLDATRLGALETHPDGGPLFATVSGLDAKGTGYVSKLVEITTDGITPLTRGAASIGNLAADATGGVFFTAKRAGDDGDEPDDPALFWLPPRGEARQLAEHAGGFGGLEARPGVLVAQVPLHSQAANETQHAQLTKERQDAKVSAALHDEFPIRYWNQDLGPARDVLAVATLPADLATATGSAAPDSSDETSVLHFGYPAMPDGRLLSWIVSSDGTFAIVTVARISGTSAANDARLETTYVYRVDLTNTATSDQGDEFDPGDTSGPGATAGSSRTSSPGDTSGSAPQLLLASAPGHEVSSVALSPDDSRLIYENDLVWTSTTTLLPSWRVLELATGYDVPLWPDHDYWIDPVWLDDQTIASTSDDHGRGSVWIGTLTDPAPRRLAGGPEQRFAFSQLSVARTSTPAQGAPAMSTSATGSPRADSAEVHLVAAASAVDTAPFPVAINPDTGAVSPLANPADDVHTPGGLREVHATAGDGTDLRAWLVTPDGAGPHPLLVFAHGGPWGTWNAWTFRWNPSPFVAAGYAVLLPDPAISTGYGQEMIERGQAQLGGTPYTDILALTDAAMELPAVDETRTALAGGSYGGYMANWMAGHTDHRFKCIVTHASLWNTQVMGKTTDNSGWDEAMSTQHATYSPHLFADRISVPMLVIHGDKDYRVPIGQGLELWMDLLTKSRTQPGPDGKTAHRFLYFPDEGHWVLGRGNAQVWYETVLGFVNRHVRGIEWEQPATLG